MTTPPHIRDVLPLTDGTANLLGLAVAPVAQGGGIGSELVTELERRLCAAGTRLLIIQTSRTEGFAPTRRFYTKLGYTEEARIRGYYAEGDDQVVFTQRLAGLPVLPA